MSRQSLMPALTVIEKIANRTLCATALLIAAACDAGNQPGNTAQATSLPPIELSASRVGGITAETPFTVEAIGEAFPHREVAEEKRSTEGEVYSVIAVREDERILLTVNPKHGKVDSIIVTSDKVNNTLGHTIGSRFTAVYEGEATPCSPGQEELSGRVLCPAPVASNMTYIFEGEWHGPDGMLPPSEVLDQWHLSQVVWTSNAAANRIQENAGTGPSFDCSKALGKVEKMICADPKLAALDRELAETHERAVEAAAEIHQRQLRASQRGWIKGRNDCWKAMQVNVTDCVAASYRARIAELEQLGDDQ